MNKKIIGGVSPLKKLVIKGGKSRKGGTKSKSKATKTSKREGGFGKSTGDHNRAGYNVQTRFKVTNGKTPPGSTPSTPSTPKVASPEKPYSFDKDGNMVFNVNVNQNQNQNQGGGGETKTKTKTTTAPDTWEEVEESVDLGSYQEAWDKMDSKKQATYKDINDFAKQADDWWVKKAKAAGMSVSDFKKTYKKTKKTKKKVKGKTTTTTEESSGGGGGGNNQSQYQTVTVNGKKQ